MLWGRTAFVLAHLQLILLELVLLAAGFSTWLWTLHARRAHRDTPGVVLNSDTWVDPATNLLLKLEPFSCPDLRNVDGSQIGLHFRIA